MFIEQVINTGMIVDAGDFFKNRDSVFLENPNLE